MEQQTQYGFLPPGETPVGKLENTTGYCLLTDKHVYLGGNYYLRKNHKLTRYNGGVFIKNADVMRLGVSKSYSRLMLAIPMVLGLLALYIKAVPALEISSPWLADFLPKITFWAWEQQDTAFIIVGLLCVATVPLYLASYKKLLEVTTPYGSYGILATNISEDSIQSLGKICLGYSQRWQ